MKSFISQLLDSAALLSVICSTSFATSASFNANYEDLHGAIAPIGAETPGTYESIIYSSWVTRADNASLVGGYAPHSPPNSIITSARLQASNGTPSFTVASPYTNASFKSFWFACNLDTEETTADVAVKCTITVAGFQKKNNQETAVASFTASPPLNLVGKFAMVQAVLPSSFNNVYNVTVVPDNPTEHTLAIDNLVYTLYK